MADSWSLETTQKWLLVFRDVLSFTVGAILLVWQGVFAMTTDPVIVGAGLIALGLTPPLRIDEMLRNRASEPAPEEARK